MKYCMFTVDVLEAPHFFLPGAGAELFLWRRIPSVYKKRRLSKKFKQKRVEDISVIHVHNPLR